MLLLLFSNNNTMFSSNNIKKLSEGIRAATMLVYGGSDGSGEENGVKLHSLLGKIFWSFSCSYNNSIFIIIIIIIKASRSNEIIDYSVRIYEGRDSKFVHDPINDDDKKCSEDVLSIGAIWLDAYSR